MVYGLQKMGKSGEQKNPFASPGDELLGAAPLSYGMCPHCGQPLRDRNACFSCKRRVERAVADEGFFVGGFRKTVQRMAAMNMKSTLGGVNPRKPLKIVRLLAIGAILGALGAGGYLFFKNSSASVNVPSAPAPLAALPEDQTSSAGLSNVEKAGTEKFAKQVAMHLLDTSAETYEYCVNMLMNGELAPEAVAHLQKTGLLPKNLQEQKAQAKSLAEKQQINMVNIDQTVVHKKNAQGLVPCDLFGVITSYSKKNRAGASASPFEMKLLVSFNDNQPIIHSIDKVSVKHLTKP